MTDKLLNWLAVAIVIIVIGVMWLLPFPAKADEGVVQAAFCDTAEQAEALTAGKPVDGCGYVVAVVREVREVKQLVYLDQLVAVVEIQVLGVVRGNVLIPVAPTTQYALKSLKKLTST